MKMIDLRDLERYEAAMFKRLRKKIDAYTARVEWPNFWFIALTPIVAIGGTIWVLLNGGPHWATWILAFAMLMLSGLGITGGYHRLFSHKTYRAHWLVRLGLLLLGGAAFEGSAREWCCQHRKHHRFVDHDGDPYNVQQGFWYAHIGWVILKADQSDESGIRDLLQDALVRWQDRYYILSAAAVSFVLPTALAALWGDPWGGLFIAGFARVVLNLQLTFLINSYCHYFGRQTYTDENSARDSWFISIFTYGEGFHNFHHAFPGDYRNGVRAYHWDPAKWLIQLLAWLRLATDLRQVRADRILAARLVMQEKRLLARAARRARVAAEWEQLVVKTREQVELLHARWSALRIEYRSLKQAKLAEMQDRLTQLRAEMRQAHRDFKAAWQQWRRLGMMPA